MGITERREREREEVRRKILDAARTLFASEGYERVTMRAIAEAIEYSPTTIYNHFEDKDDLVQSLCQEDFTRLLGALSAHPAPADPVERIRLMARAYARFGLENPNHYRFMFMTPHLKEDQRPSPAGEQAYSLVHRTVEEAIAAGRFRTIDAHAAAQTLWSSLHGVVALLITYTPDKFPCAPAREDLVEQVIENGLRGVLKAPA